MFANFAIFAKIFRIYNVKYNFYTTRYIRYISHIVDLMSDKPQFASRIGLIAATVGSAVGLGNVWRFPAEAQAGGGAAFLFIYILCHGHRKIP